MVIFRINKSNRVKARFHVPNPRGTPLCGAGKRVLGWQSDFCAEITCKSCNKILDARNGGHKDTPSAPWIERGILNACLPEPAARRIARVLLRACRFTEGLPFAPYGYCSFTDTTLMQRSHVSRPTLKKWLRHFLERGLFTHKPSSLNRVFPRLPGYYYPSPPSAWTPAEPPHESR